MKTIKYKITLTEPMLGTIPKNKEVFSTYIATKVADKEGIDYASEVETVEDLKEKGYTGFHSDEQGIFIFDYMIKGFLKNAGNTLKDIQKVKALSSKIDNFVFIFPRKIHVGKTQPDGILERPLRAMTMQGPRVTLAKSDYIDAGVSFDIELKLLSHKEVSEKIIDELFEYGQLKGLGQFRNGSYGRFVVEKI